MPHEFNNRIAAQRSILHILNDKKWVSEQLFGLSSKAIDRWISVNQINPDSNLISLVREASAKLFFLANKSQEQVTGEYRMISAEIVALRDAIARETARAYK